MKKLLLVLLVFVVALPSVASALQPSGTPVMAPDSAADSGDGAGAKSWLANHIFFVRAHTCRILGVTICGPDPLINSGAPFNGVIRIWVPFSDSYTVYFFISDPEGNVVSFQFGTFNLGGNSYTSFFSNFAPLSDGLYKFHGLAIANGSGLVAFSNFYQFRSGGPGSGGCCP